MTVEVIPMHQVPPLPSSVCGRPGKDNLTVGRVRDCPDCNVGVTLEVRFHWFLVVSEEDLEKVT